MGKYSHRPSSFLKKTKHANSFGFSPGGRLTGQEKKGKEENHKNVAIVPGSDDFLSEPKMATNARDRVVYVTQMGGFSRPVK